MHIDATTLPDGAVIEGDLCIVGAGAAGIALALEFVGRAERVVLLEGGGFDLEGEQQALLRGEIVGRPYYPLDAARLHYFGGTTGHWGGYCAPLDPQDFERRDWVPHSGWPFARAELDRYYARAQPLVELGPYRYDADYWIAQDARRERLPLDAAVVQEKMWQFSPPTRFGSRYRAAIVGAPNVQLYTHANVCEVVPNEAVTAVESLVVRHFGGATQQVRARRYVLACCTLQTVRLLLASNRRAPAGLGNRHGQVGRCFMEHLEMPVGRVAMLRPQSMQLYAFDWGATKARAELVLSAAQQRALGVLNASAALEPIADDGREAVSTFEGESPEEVEAFRRETKDGLTDAMRAEYAATPPHDAASVRARPFFTLVTRQEQAPNPDSRVTLGRDCDALGVPRIRLDWRFTALDKRTMRETFLALARELGRAGVARVQLRDWVLADDDTWPPMVSGGWHHLGATRMHEDPRHGVVDAHGRVHDLANLYVAGGGVFPTGGAANPTLTIVALALRLADRLQATAADTT